MRSENERRCSVACLESSSRFDDSVVKRNFRAHRLIHLFTEELKFGTDSEDSSIEFFCVASAEHLRRLIRLYTCSTMFTSARRIIVSSKSGVHSKSNLSQPKHTFFYTLMRQ